MKNVLPFFEDLKKNQYATYYVHNDSLLSSGAITGKFLDVYRALYPFNSFIMRALTDT